MNNHVLLLFSGGRDSFLSACLLLEKGHDLSLVTFENGCGLKPENAAHGAARLIERYGKERVHFLGVQNVAGFWREYFLPYFNQKPSENVAEYGELPVSQFHCMTCRSAMYVWTIIRALQEDIRLVADGARKEQGFVIELPSFVSEIKQFFGEYGIELLLPVFELNSDQTRKNALLARGFVPKTLEPQCLLGVPLPSDGPLDEEIQNAVIKHFRRIVAPRSRLLIEQYKNADIQQLAEALC